MKHIIHHGFPTALVAIVAIITCSSAAWPDDISGRNRFNIDCNMCHTCEVPTVEDPCVKPCPLPLAAHQRKPHSLNEAPQLILMDEIARSKAPVRFDHRLHAEMAEMDSECATCHHYSPAGRIPACKECHSESSETATLRMPTLMAAYHRQCLSCHREWSHETDCDVCHTSSVSPDGSPNSQGDPTDILGTAHPAIPVPVAKVYQTSYKKLPFVTFQHVEHIELLELRCVDCHRKEGCRYCHDLEAQVLMAKTQEEVHEICSSCHDIHDNNSVDSSECARCHSREAQAPRLHSIVGTRLPVYLKRLGCIGCHPERS